MEKVKELSIGTWISTGSPVITEVVASLGFDWLLFDLEHGCMTEADVVSNLQAASKYKARVIVRIGEFKSSLIAKVLDWGAMGIMLPNAKTAEEVKKVVSAMYYPPKGLRGFSSSARAFEYGNILTKDLSEYSPLLLVQIENRRALDEIEKIAAIDEVNVLFVGPSDLKLNLLHQEGNNIIEYNRALDIVVDVAKKNNKQAGILIRDINDYSQLEESGFSCIALSSDIGILRNGYKILLKTLGKSHI